MSLRARYWLLGGPNRVVRIRGMTAERDFTDRPDAVLQADLKFVLSGRVGEVGNPFAVGRPGGVTLAGTGRPGDVLGIAVF